MKFVCGLFLPLVGALLLSGCQGRVAPSAGWEVGSGGDPLAVEFTMRAKFVLNVLNQRGRFHSILSSTDRSSFSQAIIDTRVELTDALLTDRFGSRVIGLVTIDPKRPGKMMIHVNRTGYLSGGAPGGQNLNQFVFHEYLWVLGKNDLNYRISDQLDVSEADFRRFKDLNGIEPPLLVDTSAEPQWTGGGDEILGVDGAGNAVLVWMPAKKAKVFSRSYRVGEGWQPPELVCDEDCGPPQVAVAKNGDAIVTWVPEVPFPHVNICGLRAAIRRHGATWSAPQCLGSPAFEPYGPRLSVSIDATGDPIVAAGNIDKAVSYRDSGGGWRNETIYAFRAKSTNQLMKVWEADNGDAAVLVLSNGAYHVIRSLGAGDWFDSLTLPGAVGQYGTPKLVMRDSGQLLVTWSQIDANSLSIQAKMSGGDGNWGPTKEVAHLDQTGPVQWLSLFPLLENSSEQSIVAWRAQLGETTSPASSKQGIASLEPSGSWRSNLVSWDQSYSAPENLRPLISPDGNIELVWSGTNGQVWVGDPGQSDLSPRLLSKIQDGGQILDLSVAVANGKGFAVWKERSDQGLAIWVNHFDL